MIRTLTATAVLLSSAATALAGGYVIPAPDVEPVLEATQQLDWKTTVVGGLVVALLIALFKDGGGRDYASNDQPANPPDDDGGSCFCEGTLIWIGPGRMKPVEAIRVGDKIGTSEGMQRVLSVESWTPTRFKDRPVIYEGVRLSPNHGVCAGDTGAAEVIIPAIEASSTRGRIDGRRYYHILVENHAWVLVSPEDRRGYVVAETLRVTADMPKLATRFPHLVEHHAAHPVAPPPSRIPAVPARRLMDFAGTPAAGVAVVADYLGALVTQPGCHMPEPDEARRLLAAPDTRPELRQMARDTLRKGK